MATFNDGDGIEKKIYDKGSEYIIEKYLDIKENLLKGKLSSNDSANYLSSIGRGPELPSLPLPNPQKLIQSPGHSQIQRFQGEIPAERFGRYEDWEQYKRGGHSIIYLATDSETGRRVAIKEHLDYMPERADEAQAIRDAKARYEREIAILGKLDHPGIVDAYGYFFRNQHGIPRPYLVMEPLEQETLEDQLARGETSSEQDSRRLLLSVGAIADYLHTANGRPIIYRDMKPGNIKVMEESSEWPHKLVDFSESRIGNATMSGSVLGTFGYNAPELYGLGIADRTSDFYSLLRIAAHMMMGEKGKFMKTYMEEGAIREMREQGDLNISEQMLKAIERGTARDPEHRYKTLAELAKDLGYNIPRAPQTRQELEAILGHKALPAEIKKKSVPKKQEIAKGEDSNLQTVERVEDHGDYVTIGGYDLDKPSKEESVYKILSSLWDSKKNKIYPSLKEYRDRIVFAYLQHIAPQFPAIQDALTGERTLEDAVMEKKPIVTDFHKFDEDPSPQKIEKTYEQAKAEYLARRKQLYEIFGAHKGDFGFVNNGYLTGLMAGGALTIAGVIGGVHEGINGNVLIPLSILLPCVSTSIGSKIQNILAKHKLKEQSREADGFIQEARRTLNPSPLEEKVESVELTESDKLISTGIGGTNAFLMMLGSEIAEYAIFGDSFVNSLRGALIPIGVAISSWILTGKGINKYLKNRKLKQKRLAAGLDEDGMREYPTLLIPKNDFAKMKYLLAGQHKLKRGFNRKRFTGEDVKVSYGKHLEYYDTFLGDVYSGFDVKVRAKPGSKKAQEIIEALRHLSRTQPRIFAGSSGMSTERFRQIQSQYTKSPTIEHDNFGNNTSGARGES